jgi:hypothetical protein
VEDKKKDAQIILAHILTDLHMLLTSLLMQPPSLELPPSLPEDSQVQVLLTPLCSLVSSTQFVDRCCTCVSESLTLSAGCEECGVVK